jgi:hypothetical protein
MDIDRSKRYTQQEVEALSSLEWNFCTFYEPGEREPFFLATTKEPRGPQEVDYRALLAKYIAHVMDCEGCNFIETTRHSDVKFSLAETDALKALARSANQGPADILEGPKPRRVRCCAHCLSKGKVTTW